MGVLFLDLDAGYMSVFMLCKSSKLCTYMYTFLYVNYTPVII